MENRSSASIENGTSPLTLYIDRQILNDFGEFNYSQLKKVEAFPADISIQKIGNLVKCQYAEEHSCELPYYKINIIQYINGILSQTEKYPTDKSLFDFLKVSESINRKIFSNPVFLPLDSDKSAWNQTIKTILHISKKSHGLNSLIGNLLKSQPLEGFETCLILLHIKGQKKAEFIGTLWREHKVKSLIAMKDFNHFFNTIKKSKIKSFTSDTFPNLDLPFNGTFLAHELQSKQYSLIAIASRHDFLGYLKSEIEQFKNCIELLAPYFEKMIDQEYSDNKVSEIRVCFENFPLPIKIEDNKSESQFSNSMNSTQLVDQDVFFTKKCNEHFTLSVYDSDELRHYAFDLFHFQRISLLGELLNTLRHELSNPLFGLKLGSDIFAQLSHDQDSQSMMQEIGVNILRCQTIMENFSNLYRPTPVNTAYSLKTMIDEAFLLAKSETREIKKSIDFYDETENIEIKVPIIFVIQIIFNLIINAAQAMRDSVDKKELHLEIRKNDKYILINFFDSGPGINPENEIKLFRPFFTTKKDGTGLGLTLSRNLAHNMGGDLEFIPGYSGTHFRLSLPFI